MTGISSEGLAQIFDSRATSDPVLDAREVTVRFGGVVAVNKVDLVVGEYDVAMLVGPNGAGKSTVLNAVSGAVRSSGSILIDRTDVTGMKSFQRVQAGLGRTFQDPVLIEGQTVVENVMAGAHHRLRYRLSDQLFRNRYARRLELEFLEKAHLLLDMLGIGQDANLDASSLPYGARKVVDMARATIAGPKLLLLDEPTSGLDHNERDIVTATLVALREARCVGIVAVEHHMDVVRTAATSVTALEAGSALMTGTPDQVLGSEKLKEAFAYGTSGKVIPQTADEPSSPADSSRVS